MRKSKRRGIALITAIWILAVLMILVGGMAAVVHSEVQVARNFGALAEARWAAKAGFRRAEAMVTEIVAQPYTALDDTRPTFTSADDEEPLRDAAYEVVIEDEAGKLNINTATAVELSAFFPEEVVDAILDWRDADAEPEPQGAEEEYYAGLTAPYHCRNAAFETVGELLLVKGVTRDLLATVITEDGRTVEDLLTVYSRDSNTDAQGQARINLASADEATLTEAFGDVLTEEEAAAIVKQRSSSSFESPADLLLVPELPREKVAEMYDRLTTSEATTFQGLININTAPVEMLAVLPGMDEAMAQAIVEYRREHGPFEHVGQVLTVDDVSDSAFQRVAGKLTARSRCFRVVATGRREDGVTQTVTGVIRADADGDQTTIRMLYWHE